MFENNEREFLEKIGKQEQFWAQIKNAHISPDATLLACSESSVHRRIFEFNGLIFKVVTAHDEKYQNTLEAEYEILEKYKGNENLPEAVFCDTYDDCSILGLKKYHAAQIGQFGDFVTKHEASIRSILSAFLKLNLSGLRHGDAHIGNILFLPNERLKIVDFDQAIVTTPLSAFLGDFFCMGRDRGERSVVELLARITFSRLPSAMTKYLRLGSIMRRRRFSKSEHESPEQLDFPALAEIWRLAGMSDANAPNECTCYYSLRYDGSIYGGERAWEPRWASIEKVLDFKGKRLLELGCNVGLLSCYAQSVGALPGGLAIDCDHKIIEAAKRMAQFVGVSVIHRVCDFDSSLPWEEDVSVDNFNIVSALSVINWVKNKERLLKFISQFPELLYEGHDSLSIEVSRLKAIGFRKIQIVSVSERGRAVLHASK